MTIKNISFGDAAGLILSDKTKEDQITVNDKGIFYGCFGEDQALGEILMGVISTHETANTIRVKSFYVKKYYRNRGIGEILLRYVVDVKPNKTYTAFASKFSQSLFKKHGFEVVSEKKNNIMFMKKRGNTNV